MSRTRINVFTGKEETVPLVGNQVWLNGKWVSTAELDKAFEEIWIGKSFGYQAGKTTESQSMGCLPKEVKAKNEELRKHGVSGAHYKKNGKLHIESRQARNHCLRLYGMTDLDGGFGDV